MQIEYTNKVLASKLLSLQHKEEWKDCLSRLPESMQDVYFTPEYYEIYEKNGDGKALCFVFEEGNNLALYPFLLNRINDLGYELDDNYYDIQGAYGYNGVVYSSEGPDFIKKFYNEFNKFCKGNNIIAEFTRFHPLLGNHEFSKDDLDISYNRQVVYVDLTKGYDEIYKNYSRKIRRNLNLAEQNNLMVKIFENNSEFKNAFIDLYTETMNKVGAADYLHFNDDYFDNLFKNLPIVQFVVFKDEEPIASSLCIYGSHYFHSHLGASSEAYLSLGTNSLIYDSKIQYSIEKNFKVQYLGGGKSSADDDSLLAFKKKFSKTTKNFYIGKKIYNKEVLDKIYEQWENKYPNLFDKNKNKLLRYRVLLISLFALLQF